MDRFRSAEPIPHAAARGAEVPGAPPSTLDERREFDVRRTRISSFEPIAMGSSSIDALAGAGAPRGRGRGRGGGRGRGRAPAGGTPEAPSFGTGMTEATAAMGALPAAMGAGVPSVRRLDGRRTDSATTRRPFDLPGDAVLPPSGRVSTLSPALPPESSSDASLPASWTAAPREDAPPSGRGGRGASRASVRGGGRGGVAAPSSESRAGGDTSSATTSTAPTRGSGRGRGRGSGRGGASMASETSGGLPVSADLGVAGDEGSSRGTRRGRGRGRGGGDLGSDGVPVPRRHATAIPPVLVRSASGSTDTTAPESRRGRGAARSAAFSTHDRESAVTGGPTAEGAPSAPSASEGRRGGRGRGRGRGGLSVPYTYTFLIRVKKQLSNSKGRLMIQDVVFTDRNATIKCLYTPPRTGGRACVSASRMLYQATINDAPDVYPLATIISVPDASPETQALTFSYIISNRSLQPGGTFLFAFGADGEFVTSALGKLREGRQPAFIRTLA